MNKVFSNLSWVLSKIEKIKIKIAIIILLSLAFAFITLSEVFVLQSIINSVLDNQLHTTVVLALSLAGILIAKGIFPSIMEYFGLKLLQIPLVDKLTKMVLSAVYTMPLGELKETSNATYVDVLTQDIQAIGSGIKQKTQSISFVVQMLVLMFLLGRISIYILLITVVLGGLYLLIGKIFTEKFLVAMDDYFVDVTLIHKVTEEGVAATREVLAYNRAKWEKDRRIRVFDRYYIKAKKLKNMENLQFLTTNIIKWTLMVFFLLYGGYLVINSSMSIAVYVAIYRYCDLFLNSAEVVYNEATDLSKIVAKISRVQKLTYDTEKPESCANIGKIKTIEFCNVSFKYDDNSKEEVLRDVSFKIEGKKKIAIVGPSGGGKSTIIKLLLSIIKPTGGTIKVNGIDLSTIDSDEWIGKKTAICFQDTFLFADTIRNNILFGYDTADEKIVEVCKKVRFYDFIKKQEAGLSTEIGDRGITLSGGERQRLALARLFTKDVDIYILDEATSAIDISTEEILQQNINDIVYDKGGIMFVVAHRLSTIKDADEIIVVKDGYIAERGDHDTLLNNNGLYKQLIDEQKVAV